MLARVTDVGSRLGKAPRKYEVPVEIGETVLIDGDPEMKAVVTAVCWRATMAEVEVSWLHGGEVRFAWLPPWRLAADA